MSSVSYLVALLAISEAALLFGALRWGLHRRFYGWLRERSAGRLLAIGLGVFAGWFAGNVLALTVIIVAWDVWNWTLPDGELAWVSFVFVAATMVVGGYVGYRIAESEEATS